ncbi:MAG: type IX secretion system membrane protein PorP/SprF [Flavobacteriia bacterium]|jgi:type IX secretion system PorP/SprF family membrane protein|nr:type IX secretion system membrane protein PorP/SprF [Flavobacteriia bacterium]
MKFRQRFFLFVSVLFVLALTPIKGSSQDFHLTQADRSIAFLNPAFVGAYKGFERISLLNRNQWIGSGTQFLTSYGMAEFTPGRTRQAERAYAGVAASFSNDVGGDSRMTQKSFGLTASGHLPLAKGHWLDAGIQTAIQQRSADFSKLLYYSQWNGSSLDPSVYSGEENDFVNFAFVDAGLGLAYRFEPNQRGELRDGQWSLQTGFSLQHVNRPRLQYNTLSADRLYQKAVIYSCFSLGLNEISTLQFSLTHLRQGGHSESMLGAIYRMKLRGSSQVTNEVSTRYMSAGLYFRSSAAIAPYFSLDFGAFDFGVSYDADLGATSSVFRHSVELNASYTFLKKSAFKGSRLR